MGYFACEVYFFRFDEKDNDPSLKPYCIDNYNIIYSRYDDVDALEIDYDIMDSLFSPKQNEKEGDICYKFQVDTKEEGDYYLYVQGTYEYEMSQDWESGIWECDGMLVTFDKVCVQKINKGE